MKKISALLFSLSFIFNVALSAIPAQVIIIPHAELDPIGYLSQEGLERAGALAPYITMTSNFIIYGVPVSIFAARPTPIKSPYPSLGNAPCCLQTITPTAQFLNQPIHPGYSVTQEQTIADFILNNASYDGKNILVCWWPEYIPTLAAAFGVASPPPFGILDNVTWVITFSPTVTLTTYEQHLLYGDNGPI